MLKSHRVSSEDAPRSNRSWRSLQCCDSHGGDWGWAAIALTTGSSYNSSNSDIVSGYQDINDDLIGWMYYLANVQILTFTQ